MSDELLYLVLPPLGWFLWAAGGTFWKGYRRYIYPVVFGIALLTVGTLWWRAWLAAICSSLVAHQGYGEGKSWSYRAMVGLLLSLSLMPLGWSLMLLVPGSVFLVTFWMSRRWNSVPWKWAEGMVGGSHALTAVWIVTHP